MAAARWRKRQREGGATPFILVQIQAGPPAFAQNSVGFGHLALGELQALGVAGGRLDDGVEQAREACVEILAAQSHIARGPDDAGLDQTSLTQLREMIGEIRLAAEGAEVAAA